jgi:DNA/RNA-binding domain of Phe-tRNA-synthetase-like protein
MQEFIDIATPLQDRFPNLAAQITRFKDVDIERKNPVLEEFKKQVVSEIKAEWGLDDLREHHVFRAYRDFFWDLDIDPTKTRPAAEALIRRVLRNRKIPQINTWVDSYNLASMKTAIPIASFDIDLLHGPLKMREARKREEFLGIGMSEPFTLSGCEVVIEDGKKLVAIYPYRDADYSKVSLKTDKVLMLLCGAPGIKKKYLNQASQISSDIVTKFCGGEIY